MRKLILLLALLLALSAGAWAGDLSGVGEGITVDEAKANALASLKDTVFVKLYSSTKLHEKDDGTSHSQSYEKTVLMESEVELYGVECRETQLGDGTWRVTAFIPKERQAIYANEIQKLAASLKGTDWEKRGDWNDFGPYYMKKIEAWDRFDAYSLILMLLNEKAAIPEVPARSEFEAALDRAMGSSNSSLEMEIKLAESKQKRGKMTREEEERLEERKREHERIQQESLELKKRKEKESRAYAQKREDEDLQYSKKLAAALEKRGQMAKKADDQTSVIGLVAQIEDWREYYGETKSKLAQDLKESYESFCAEADRKAKEIYCRSYYPVQLDSSGMPQVDSLVARVNEADREIYKIYKESYDLALGQYTVYDKSLRDISKEADRLIKDLSSRRFSVSSLDGGVSTQIKSADLRKGEWSGKAYFFLGNATLELDFTIPYTDWTDKKVASNANPESWESYVADFDRWDTRFMNPDSYTVEISYHLKGSADSNEYTLCVDSVAVCDPMKGGKTVWRRLNPYERYTLKIGQRVCDMTNPYVSNQFFISGPEKDAAAEVERELAAKRAQMGAPAVRKAPLPLVASFDILGYGVMVKAYEDHADVFYPEAVEKDKVDAAVARIRESSGGKFDDVRYRITGPGKLSIIYKRALSEDERKAIIGQIQNDPGLRPPKPPVVEEPKAEEPKPIVKTQFRRRWKSSLLIGADFAVSKKIEGGAVSIISVGMRKISPKPLFANTRFSFDAGLGVVSPDSFLRPAGLRGAAGIGLMLVSFLDSYSYIDWGLNLGVEVDPGNLAASSAKPSFRIGYGDEGRGRKGPGSVRFWLQAGVGLPFDKSVPKPVAGVGMTVGLYVK